ncbi:Transcriptional adapter 2-alpha [Liparis tanakae]|uniref:Transcriptional adapter 2-alpha n=1 Tax=Liparis tanakae TaxID=230148 RepID=A0A4Z2E3E9_9TELE|nr:Transcriptional adapter 2-alpha [Liparis tanakae]
MRRFARVVGPIEHDKFIESHALEFELRREIRRLQEFRKAGIKSFCSEFTLTFSFLCPTERHAKIFRFEPASHCFTRHRESAL